MGKLALVPLLLPIFVAALVVLAVAETEHEGHLKHNGLGPERLTHLHFFFHDSVSGKNPSAIRVAAAPTTDHSPSLFGLLMMADDPLTEGPDPTSKQVGRAHGLYGSASQQELGLVMAMSYCFTDGVYNGSTLSVMGLNSAAHPVREMPVVGGTGVFRFARGVAVAKTYWANFTSGDAIVEYNVTAIHY